MLANIKVYDDIIPNNYGAKELEQAVNQQKIGVYDVKNKTLVDDLYGKLHRII